MNPRRGLVGWYMRVVYGPTEHPGWGAGWIDNAWPGSKKVTFCINEILVTFQSNPLLAHQNRWWPPIFKWGKKYIDLTLINPRYLEHFVRPVFEKNFFFFFLLLKIFSLFWAIFFIFLAYFLSQNRHFPGVKKFFFIIIFFFNFYFFLHSQVTTQGL